MQFRFYPIITKQAVDKPFKVCLQPVLMFILCFFILLKIPVPLPAELFSVNHHFCVP